MAEIEFVGVDGCKRAWFSVGFASDGEYELKMFPKFDELAKYYSAAKLILVDIPIGLPEGKGGRKVDGEAKKKLGKLAPAVFPTPCRCTVHSAWQFPKDHARANEIELRCAGKGLSIFTFSICPKIAEVDTLMQYRGADASPPIREVHPEICFWAFNGRKPMEFSKKGEQGIKERRDLLLTVEPKSQEIFEVADSQFPKKNVAKDDILDALAVAVTARMGYPKPSKLPEKTENPPLDPKGLPMEMVYWEPPAPRQ